MVSKFLREQKRYSLNDLREIFECSENETIAIIRKLKEFGLLKTVKASDLQRDLSDLAEDDVEIVDVSEGGNDYLYIFTFVGIIIVFGRVLKCYPKYLNINNPKEELKQVIRVLEKYNSKEQVIKVFNESNDTRSFNLLAVLLYLINDYYEYGLYNNLEDVIEENGSGEILWDRTINETFTLLSNNRPYYVNLQTKKHVTNEYDYFQRLHECILTNASRELKQVDLLDLFDITEIDLTDEDIEDFGDKEYILYRIEKELNIQFNTRKQVLLKTIYAYIDHIGTLNEIESLSVFGTNSFNLIWEDVCADIMDNQLNKQLGSLKLPYNLKPEYDPDDRLIDIVEKPLWTATGKVAEDTLIPDLIAFNGDKFIIIDAKYYVSKLESGSAPKGQPGIESITKQYLYQLAYQRFIQDHGFLSVANCFIMPTENETVEKHGVARLSMLSLLGLQDIQVRFLPATIAFDHYLSGQKLDYALLELQT